MKIALSSDEHPELVDLIIKDLQSRGNEVIYCGPAAGEERDWPVVTGEAVSKVISGEVQEAIVMCWTGTGASMAANKFPGIRAALCVDAETARGARKWNHANVLALSIRLTTGALAKEILDAWFSTPFTTDEWNLTQMERLNKLDKR